MGTTHPSNVLGWFVYYTHSFRMELFFLLYPMKVVLAALWIAGGRVSGWLQLPPNIAVEPWWRLSLGGLRLESWPDIQLTQARVW